METRKISSAQLDQLFAFTRQHFVEYYDLQAELADHLGNAIEERWQQQPHLSFDEALRIEFKKFGIFGFSDIVEQRQNSLMKKYYRLVWQEFRSALDFRVVAISALAGFVLYNSIVVFPWVYSVVMLLFLSGGIHRLWGLRKQYRERLRQTGKKWLLEEIIFSCGGMGIIMCLPIQLLRIGFNDVVAPPIAAVISVMVILIFIYGYVALYRMPAKAYVYLNKAYPEYAAENLA